MITPEIRQLIHTTTARVWPEYSPLLVEAQVLAESNGDPNARSACGACGLLQLMPATAAGLGLSTDRIFDPAANLQAGITYLRQQFKAFAELPQFDDRLSAALASYNGGRGYVNKALALARQACGIADTVTPGPWQRWDVAGAYLLDARCVVAGKRPDAAQMLIYVARIRAIHYRLTKGGQA